VTVEKHEVCRGEENFATIVASAANGDDRELGIELLDRKGSRQFGPRVPFRLTEPTSPGAMPQLVVFDGGTRSAVARIPEVRVKDCDVDHRVDVRGSITPPNADDWQFTVSIGTRTGAEPFEAVAYSWNFGDGTPVVTTSEGAAKHSYAGRIQATRYTYPLVTVRLEDASGRRIQGSRALRLMNFGFEALERERRVQIFAAIEREGDRPIVRLYHGHSSAVQLERVKVTRGVLGSESDEGRELGEYTAQNLFGFVELPAGRSMAAQSGAALAQLEPAERGAVSEFEVEGVSADGLPARGSFALFAPTRDDTDASEPEAALAR
jgi:hypothetical protein